MSTKNQTVFRNVGRYADDMTDKRAVRRKTRSKVSDPIAKRMMLQKRKEDAPPGFVVRRVLCEKVGLNNAQFRALTKTGVIVSDGANSNGYALYTNETVRRLMAMKGDGTLFRSLASMTSDVIDDVPAAGNATPTASVKTAPLVTPAMHYSAEDGVRVFELLDEGKQLKDIILSTRIHPLIVKAILVDYDDLIGSIQLPKDIVDRLNALGNDGKLPGAFPLRDANDVFAVVELCTVERTCSSCAKNAALTSCEECLVQGRRAMLRSGAA